MINFFEIRNGNHFFIDGKIQTIKKLRDQVIQMLLPNESFYSTGIFHSPNFTADGPNIFWNNVPSVAAWPCYDLFNTDLVK